MTVAEGWNQRIEGSLLLTSERATRHRTCCMFFSIYLLHKLRGGLPMRGLSR